MNRIEVPKLAWSEKFNPAEEAIIYLGSITLIAKPIRLPTLEKPGRDLSALAPRSAEIQEFFTLRDVYKERVYSYGTSGFHYHKHKIEIIFPLATFKIYFHDIKTGQTFGVDVPERIGDTTFGFFVKPEVAHAIYNPSRRLRFYTVLANMFEEESEKIGDVIPFQFPLPATEPLQALLASSKTLK